MELDLEKLKTLIGVQKGVETKPQAAHPMLQLHYIQESRLGEIQIGQNVTTDLSLYFTGIQFLEVTDRTCETLKMRTGSPFGLSGSGILCVPRTGFLSNDGHVNVSQEAVNLLTRIVDTAAIEHWGIDTFKVIVFAVAIASIDVSDTMVSIPYCISIPCTEEEWQRLFQLHSQELTAATEWYKQLQGSSEEVVTADDISPLRSLN